MFDERLFFETTYQRGGTFKSSSLWGECLWCVKGCMFSQTVVMCCCMFSVDDTHIRDFTVWVAPVSTYVMEWDVFDKRLFVVFEYVGIYLLILVDAGFYVRRFLLWTLARILDVLSLMWWLQKHAKFWISGIFLVFYCNLRSSSLVKGFVLSLGERSISFGSKFSHERQPILLHLCRLPPIMPVLLSGHY